MALGGLASMSEQNGGFADGIAVCSDGSHVGAQPSGTDLKDFTR
jgi:hypothetical protein